MSLKLLVIEILLALGLAFLLASIRRSNPARWKLVQRARFQRWQDDMNAEAARRAKQ